MSSAPICPQCGKPMRQRTRQSDGGAFYGCSQYPRCTGTLDIASDTADQRLLRRLDALERRVEFLEREAKSRHSEDNRRIANEAMRRFRSELSMRER